MPNAMKRVPYLPDWYGVLRVTDTGPGLKGNFRPQPVEHGMKIDAGKAGKGDGFSMLQRIAEDAEGFVQCSPVQPRGTTTEILWPSIPEGERCCGEEAVPAGSPQPRLVKTPEEDNHPGLFSPGDRTAVGAGVSASREVPGAGSSLGRRSRRKSSGSFGPDRPGFRRRGVAEGDRENGAAQTPAAASPTPDSLYSSLHRRQNATRCPAEKAIPPV
jgi:hypothetical protein